MKFKLHDYVHDLDWRRGRIVGWHAVSTEPMSETMYQVHWEDEGYPSSKLIHGDLLILEVAEIPL